jgi:hypothetical protein
VLRVIHTIHQRLMHQSPSPNPASPAKAGAYPNTEDMGPGFPHGSSPRAEGPRES